MKVWHRSQKLTLVRRKTSNLMEQLWKWTTTQGISGKHNQTNDGEKILDRTIEALMVNMSWLVIIKHAECFLSAL